MSGVRRRSGVSLIEALREPVVWMIREKHKKLKVRGRIPKPGTGTEPLVVVKKFL